MSLSPNEAQPRDDAQQRIRRHDHVLLALTAVCVFGLPAIGQVGLPHYALEVDVVWFWLGTVAGAIIVSAGILLSYWWGIADASKRKARFTFLCIFALLFMLGASSGLVDNANTGTSLSSLMQGKPPSCELEGEVCRKFVGTNDESVRQRLADIFYQKTGANLLAAPGATEQAPPSEKADALRQQWQEIEADHLRLQSARERRVDGAMHIFRVFAGVGLLVFLGGGLVLGGKLSSAGAPARTEDD